MSTQVRLSDEEIELIKMIRGSIALGHQPLATVFAAARLGKEQASKRGVLLQWTLGENILKALEKVKK